MLRGAKVGDLFMKLIHLPIMSRQLIRLSDGAAAPMPGKRRQTRGVDALEHRQKPEPPGV